MLLSGLRMQLEEAFPAAEICCFSNPDKAQHHLDWNVVDLLITDLEFASDCGIDLAKKLKSDYPALKVVAYTSHKTASILKQIRPSKFNSYICKEASPQELINIIHRVLKVSANTFTKSSCYYDIKQMTNQAQNNFFSSDYKSNNSLTPTEKLICEMICNNSLIQNKGLAKQLNISENTLKKHITSIYKKLSVKSKEGIKLHFDSV